MSWEEWIDVLRSEDMTRIHNHFTASNINTRVLCGYTALHAACRAETPDNTDVVAHLLDCWADSEAQDELGWTPLLYAASSGKLNCMRVLLSRGAPVEPKQILNWTALAYTFACGHSECAKLLLDHGAHLSHVCAAMVPAWAPAYVAGLQRARAAALIILGSRRKQRSAVMASNGMDVIRLIAKEVWSTRGDEAW